MNTNGITIMGREITAIEVLPTKPHTGGSPQSWFIRIWTSEDDWEDDHLSPVSDMPLSATDTELRGAVVLWLLDPDGMSDDARAVLRGMIEIKR